MDGVAAQLNVDEMFLCFIDMNKALRKLAFGEAEVFRAPTKFSPMVIKLLRYAIMNPKGSVKYSAEKVKLRDNMTCQYCGFKATKMNELTIDHVLPRAKGGKTSWENCVAACRDCNSKKADMTCDEVKMYLKTRPVKPTIMEYAIKYARWMNKKLRIHEGT